MLLGLVALQRRRPCWPAWPSGPRHRSSSRPGRSWCWRPGPPSTGSVGEPSAGTCSGWPPSWLPVITPFAVSNPSAFIDNVIRFPLGLAGVSSPAASALPGHILVSIWPSIHRPYVVTVGLVGLVLLAVHLRRHPPDGAAGVATLTGWVMAIAILLAPATRVGYSALPGQSLHLGVDASSGRGPRPGRRPSGRQGGTA